MANLMRSETFPGTMLDFHTFMGWLGAQYPDGWTADNGECLKVILVPGSIPTYSARLVRVDSDEPGAPWKWAAIEAYEQPSGETLIEFRDGWHVASRKSTEPIGSAFEQFAWMIVGEWDEWCATPTHTEESAGTDDTLDPLDRKIIEVVHRIEGAGLKATDELVAKRVPLNPKTNQPYHRVTINKRRCKLRDKGYKV